MTLHDYFLSVHGLWTITTTGEGRLPPAHATLETYKRNAVACHRRLQLDLQSKR
jgi:hypothetical protein